MNDLINLFLLTSLGSLLGLAGGLLFLYNKKLSNVLENNAIPFAAGVLLTVSFLGLLPESVEIIGETAYLVVLISFFIVFLFEKVLFEIHHHDGDDHAHSHLKTDVWFVIIGDTIHNLIDGLSIGASFVINPSFGFITAFSSFLHEVPHEVGDFGILLKAKWKKKNIIIVNTVSALATFVGAFSIFLFEIDFQIVGYLLAISAGIFLYLGAIDFLPQVLDSKKGKFKNITPLLLGALIMFFVFQAVPHGHEEEASLDDNHAEEYVEELH